MPWCYIQKTLNTLLKNLIWTIWQIQYCCSPEAHSWARLLVIRRSLGRVKGYLETIGYLNTAFTSKLPPGWLYTLCSAECFKGKPRQHMPVPNSSSLGPREVTHSLTKNFFVFCNVDVQPWRSRDMLQEAGVTWEAWQHPCIYLLPQETCFSFCYWDNIHRTQKSPP